MKKIIRSLITLSIAIVGFIGGCIWSFQSHWGIEPLILLIVSFLEIIGFMFVDKSSGNNKFQDGNQEMKVTNDQNIKNYGKVGKQVNIQKNKGKIEM